MDQFIIYGAENSTLENANPNYSDCNDEGFVNRDLYSFKEVCFLHLYGPESEKIIIGTDKMMKEWLKDDLTPLAYEEDAKKSFENPLLRSCIIRAIENEKEKIHIVLIPVEMDQGVADHLILEDAKTECGTSLNYTMVSSLKYNMNFKDLRNKLKTNELSEGDAQFVRQIEPMHASLRPGKIFSEKMEIIYPDGRRHDLKK